MSHTLSKVQRLSSEKVIGKLFSGKASSFTIFPLRVVYMPESTLDTWAAVLVSVSKSRFKHAVDRNRIKRQIREAYRMNNDSLKAVLQQRGLRMAVAFIYITGKKIPSVELQGRMRTALHRLEENLPQIETVDTSAS